jgi:hypothetical protein
MRRSTGLTRALWHITIFLQLLLPTVVSAADARLERNALSARAHSHIESKTGKDCPRAHKADCALCQHITTPFARTAKVSPPSSVARRKPLAVALGGARHSSGIVRPSLPRAPPAL